MIRRIFFLVFAIIFSNTYAQFYISGQEPSNTKWHEYKSNFGRLIFPSEIDSLAQTFLIYMNEATRVVPRTLNHSPSKFPVVIHGNSILSNGFVSWAPKRMEIVATPALCSDPEPWLKTLALHETRHIVQIDKLNSSFFKPVYYLFGEQAIGVAAALVPLWFLEGDAVNTETELSEGGRGRQASFYQHYRTHFLSRGGNTFSYDKWLLGSFKDNIPNHYQFGYQMVAYSSLKYGSNIWSNALNQTARYPYSFFPFYFSLKRDTGLSRKNLHKEAFIYLDSLWRSSASNSGSTSIVFLANKAKNYTDYKYPHKTNDSTIIALKTSIKHTQVIAQININSGNESVLYRPGYITSKLYCSENAVYWSQYKSHPRWEYVDYSEIWRYDLTEGRAERLTTKTRYFNPVEMSGETIAVIENTPSGKNYISLIDRFGQKIASTEISSTLELKEICLGEQNDIYARCSSPNGTVILHYRELNSPPDTVLGPVFRDISNINIWNGSLVFTMTEDYKEELFSYDSKTNKISRLSNSSFGLNNVFISSDNSIIVSANVLNGSLPGTLVDLSSVISKELSKTSDPLYKSRILEDYKDDQKINLVQKEEFASKKHSKVKHLFNFHSWAPIYYNPFEASSGYVEAYPGITLISQNLTSTLVSSIGYSYNVTHGFHAYFEWMGWYPKISAGIDIGNDYGLIRGGPLAPGLWAYQSTPLIKTSARIRLPYKISSGYIVSEANLGLRYSYENTMLWDYVNSAYSSGLNNIEPYFTVYALTRMAHRDIRPKFGTYLYVGEISSPYQASVRGKSFIARAGIYLPGLFSHHSILLTGEREHQNSEQYLRQSRIMFPKGFQSRYLDQAITGNIEYTMPLAYPDLPIGPVIYIKRIYSNTYWDNALVDAYVLTNDGLKIEEQLLQSVGVNINADINLFRTPYSFRVGYSVGVTLDNKSVFHGFILGFDLNNLYGYQLGTNLNLFNF